MSVRLAGSNDPCEDRYAIRSRGQSIQAFGVFDGHGGFLAADIACSQLLDILLQYVDALAPEDRTPANITGILDTTFQETDKIILDEAIRIHKRRDDITRAANSDGSGGSQSSGGAAPPMKPTGRAGSCALVLLIVDGTMYFAHVGDCRAAICSSIKTGTPTRSNVLTDMQNMSPVNWTQEAAAAADGENGSESFALVDLFLECSAAAQLAKEKAQGLNKIHGNGNGNGNGNALTRNNATATKRKREEGGCYFNARGSSLALQGVTIDHTCNVTAETVAIGCMSDDIMPIRQTVVGRPRIPSQAPLRVGGSLVVTRALGDGYLKIKELSVEPFVSHCPYITCRPTISWRKMQATDRAVILASDGLWNFVSAKDCVAALTTVGRGVDSQNSQVRCPISSVCSYDSHVSTELSQHGDAGFAPNPADVYTALTTVTETQGEAEAGSEPGSEITTHPQGGVIATPLPKIGDELDKCSGSGLSHSTPSPSPSTEESAATVLLLSNRTECALAKQLSEQQTLTQVQVQVQGQGQGQGKIADVQPLNMDAAGELMDVCLRSAAYYAKTNVDVLRTMEAGNLRREMVDDITVMVLYFS